VRSLKGAATIAVRWSITFIEPLLTTRQRIECETHFYELALREPEWCATYFASLLNGVVASLATNDPWRSVQVITDASGGTNAAWPNGLSFGGRIDTRDVVVPIDELERTGTDPFTAALADEPTSSEAALIIIALGGWRPAYESLLEDLDQHGPHMIYQRATSAIRWAEHRRRSYRPGVVDTWFEYLTIESANRANDIHGGSLPTFTDDDLEGGAAKERMILDQVVKTRGLFTGK